MVRDNGERERERTCPVVRRWPSFLNLIKWCSNNVLKWEKRSEESGKQVVMTSVDFI